MRFAAYGWLLGVLYALGVAVMLILGSYLLVRALRRFGDEARVQPLLTSHTGTRRALRGILLVLGLIAAFVALARPQYGQGTRMVPATNLDVVVALDYSKSMYARDVSPSRSMRAKTEVARLIASLPGARFGAVAFAGEPSAFPLTSDGSAIAQFFRQLTPNDMPVGGTSLAKALERARQLLTADPLAKKHEKVIVLVTDGEDLQGDPIAVAKQAKEDGITIHVVQIGGRTPEPIPDVDDTGKVLGIRRDRSGSPLTTSLSAEGEQQLSEIASSSGGRIVRSAVGSTGVDELTKILSRWASEELSEKVETVYADVYAYPLGFALALLLLEAFLGDSPRRPTPVAPPPPRRLRPSRREKKKKSLATAAVAGCLIPCVLLGLASCEERRKSLFIRHSPKVDDAIYALVDAGDAGASANILQNYLSTGKCEGGNIGTPESVKKHFFATFDLGLALFKVAESFGMRFGERATQTGGADPAADQATAQRGDQVDCALRVVGAITALDDVPLDLMARAFYLAGNLHFLRDEWNQALEAYDRALRLVPGVPTDASDGIGRDAAWNRAIALQRSKEKPPPDAGNDGGTPDGGNSDGGNSDGGQSDRNDAGAPPPDGGNQGNDAGGPKEQPDAGSQPPQPDGGGQGPDASAPNEPEQQQQQQQPEDSAERVLEMLEQTPTLQEHEAKQMAGRRVRGMEDK
ncbi:MAG TPA: VWA domain-containing protein [Polyangiaceae bacterium]|nr:VWA domain-containing protein [Polyangiaceae bacterium]